MSICVDSFAPEKQGMAAAAAALNLMGSSAKENPAVRRQALEELAALRKDLFQEQASSASASASASASFPPAVIEWKSVETSMGDNGVPSITRPLLGRSSSLSDVDSKRAAAAAAAYKEESVCNNSSSSSSSSSRAALRRAKTFPPPLGSLARKSYSHCPNQVPWVLLQPIRSKNRIVLQEVKIANQMSFQPIRKEGRLVLNLIRHGDENSCGRPIAKADAMGVHAQEEPIQISVFHPEPKNASAHQAEKTELEVIAAAAKEHEQQGALAVVEEEEEQQPAFAHQASAAPDVDRRAGSSSGVTKTKLSTDKESHGLLLLPEKENAAAHGRLLLPEKENTAAAAHAHGRKYAPRIKGIPMFNNGSPDYQLQHQCRCSSSSSHKKREDDHHHHRPTTNVWEQHHNFHCVATSS